MSIFCVLCAEKTRAEDWKLNLKERKSASKTLRERVPPVGASAETTMDESARGTSRIGREVPVATRYITCREGGASRHEVHNV